MYRNSDSPADNDVTGSIEFEGVNDANQDVIYSQIKTRSKNIADSSEQGEMQFNVMSGGTLRNNFTVDRLSVIVNEDSQDVDFRVESNGLTHALFVDGGNNKVAIGTDTATATLTVNGSAVARTNTDTSNTGNVTLNFSTYQNFVLTFTGNVTLLNPTTEIVGQSGFITIIQDGTGSRTLAVGGQYFGAGGNVPTISTAANSIDVIPYIVIAAGKVLLGAAQLAFADAS